VLTVGRERQRITIGRYGPGGITLAEARRKAIAILHERERGVEHKPVPTFRAVKQEYLARRDIEVRAATLQGDGYLFKHFDSLLPRKLNEIKPSDIEAIIDAIGAPSTRRSAYIPVSGLFSFAVRKGYIDHWTRYSGIASGDQAVFVRPTPAGTTAPYLVAEVWP
jgi:hypothetical protein